MRGLTLYERETIINWNQDDDFAWVFTYDRSLITSMRKNTATVEVRRTPEGASEFRIPKRLVSIRNPRRPSQADPQATAEHMAKMRAARKPE